MSKREWINLLAIIVLFASWIISGMAFVEITALSFFIWWFETTSDILELICVYIVAILPSTFLLVCCPLTTIGKSFANQILKYRN